MEFEAMSKISEYTARKPDRLGNIHYSEEENSIWRELCARQRSNVKKFMAAEYLDGLAKLELPMDRIPQCAEISARLEAFTGWRVEPVPALIPFGRFFGMLARRRFPAAAFIRNREHFDYIEEPDIFHEIFGHTPLLTDARFAGFSQAIGRAGLAAEPADYTWLIRLYWFTIEFGLTRRRGGLRAVGAGLASSPTELPYSVQSTRPQRVAFDITTVLRTPYRIDIQQPLYYVLDSLDDLFAVVERDLLAEIRQARKLGLLAPLYPEKNLHEAIDKAS